MLLRILRGLESLVIGCNCILYQLCLRIEHDYLRVNDWDGLRTTSIDVLGWIVLAKQRLLSLLTKEKIQKYGLVELMEGLMAT